MLKKTCPPKGDKFFKSWREKLKSKELVYLASTAILLAATANVAKAEEHTIG